MVDKLGQPRQWDAAIAELARRQHGVVTTAQLTRLGLSRAVIAKRARVGRLHRVHRGVYAVGHGGISQEGRWMAAVLACGDGAVLSHGSAALWGLLRPMERRIDVSIPSRSGRRHKGIRIHRRPSLLSGRRGSAGSAAAFTAAPATDSATERTAAPPRLTTIRNRIPVTTVARTVEDLPGTVSEPLYRRAVRQAELAGHRLPNVESDRTRSDLERDFLRFCHRHGLPSPEVNVRIGPLTVDFLWRTHRLIAETDGYRYHRGATAFEDDHARDLHLRRQGYAVHRYTGAQLRNHPAELVAELGEVLRGATGEALRGAEGSVAPAS